MKKINEIIDVLEYRALHYGACLPTFNLSINNDLIGLLLSEIKKNFRKLYNEGVISAEVLNDCFTAKALAASGIYTTGKHFFEGDFLIALGDAYVVNMNADCISVCYDSASVVGSGGIFKMYGKSNIRACNETIVYAYDATTVESIEDDECVIFLYDNAKVFSKAKGHIVQK